MDEQLHERPDEHEPVARRDVLARAPGRATDHDLLDEPVLPLFGLSASTIVAIFVGGALGTVARYLLEAHHPPAAGRLPLGDPARQPERARSPSGCSSRSPSTSRTALPRCGRSSWSASSGGGPPTPRWPSTPRCSAKDGDVARCLAYLAATVAGGLALVVAGHGLGRRLVAAMSAPPPLSAWPCSSLRPAAPAPSLRALAHPSPRPAPRRPAARRHHGGQRVGFPRPRRADRALALPRPRFPRARRGRASASAGATPRGRPRAGRRSTSSTPVTAPRPSSTRWAAWSSAWPRPPPASALAGLL